MRVDELSEFIQSSDPCELAARIVEDFDRPSPLIGAEGPPDGTGPEEPYVRALSDASADVRKRFADALRVILLGETAQIAGTREVRRPLLLYNLFSLLEAIELPRIPDVLQNLRDEEQPLSDALVDQNDDLYAQLLIAHAVNQHGSSQDMEFWLRLLEHDNLDYVSAGIVGLRESGWENALVHLERVKLACGQHPELGSFEDEVMLLIDTYPDLNWPDCARDHVRDPEIQRLIEKHGRDRYVPKIDELQGPAVDIIRQAGKQEEVRATHERWSRAPVLALACD